MDLQLLLNQFKSYILKTSLKFSTGLRLSAAGVAGRSFATMSLLEHAQDHYGGVIIHAEALPNDAEAFDASLTHSLKVNAQPWHDCHLLPLLALLPAAFKSLRLLL